MASRPKIWGVYGIRNTITDRMYVGSSIDIHTRWSRHKRQLRQGTHKNKIPSSKELGINTGSLRGVNNPMYKKEKHELQ